MDAAITDVDLDEDDWTEEELALLHEAGEACLLPEDVGEEEEARRDAEAEADFAAGRYVSHERVSEWLRSLGTDHPLPRPTWRT